jgi:membrane protein
MTPVRASVLRVALAVQQRFGSDRAGYLAASIAYYGFLSMFPLLLLGGAVLGFILAADPAAYQVWLERLTGALPGLEDLVGRNLDALVDARLAASVLGLVGLLWSGLGATQAAGYAVSRVFRVEPYQSFVRQKLWAIGTTLLLGFLALLGVGLVAVVGNLPVLGLGGIEVRIAALLMAFGVDVALFLIAYRILTQRTGPPFGQLWPGALLAAGLWTLLKALGTWYVARTVAGATAVYGTFAGAVGVLLLVFLAAQILLYGAELNAVLIERRNGEGTEEEEPQPREGGDRVERSEGNGSRSTSDLLRSVAADTATLVRKEVELARQELMEGVSTKVKGAAVMGVAAVFGLFMVGALTAATAAAFSLIMPAWAAWLVTAGILLVLAGLVVAVGRALMRRSSIAPTETAKTLKEDVEWARAQLRR